MVVSVHELIQNIDPLSGVVCRKLLLDACFHRPVKLLDGGTLDLNALGCEPVKVVVFQKLMRLFVDELCTFVRLHFYRFTLLKYPPECLRDLLAGLLLYGHGPGVLSEDVDDAQNVIRVVFMTVKSACR